MKEAKWLVSVNPQLMLKSLRGKGSDRKLRLFAVACCGPVEARFTSPSSRHSPQVLEHFQKVVAVAERFADGLATENERKAAHRTAQLAARLVSTEWMLDAVTAAAFALQRTNALLDWTELFGSPEHGEWYEQAARYANNACKRQNPTQSSFIRCIFGNPFRSVAMDARWCISSVAKLAQAIYTDRAFDRLPILADALEDAGCTNEDILAHCRGPGPHVRGCWVVDLLLGRS